jgi:hypothetical protein
VENAVNDHVTSITVSNSDYQLLYGTVAPSTSQSVRFEVEIAVQEVVMDADCNGGRLNGRSPQLPGRGQTAERRLPGGLRVGVEQGGKGQALSC